MYKYINELLFIYLFDMIKEGGGLKNMNRIIRVISRLLLGFIVYGLAIVVMIHANIGLSPWDVLHQELSLKTGFTMGQIS